MSAKRRRGKGMRPTNEPSGRIVRTIRTPDRPDGKTPDEYNGRPHIPGKRLLAIAYVKTGARKYRREFSHLCETLGIVAVAEQSFGTFAEQSANAMLDVTDKVVYLELMSDEVRSRCLQQCVTDDERAHLTAYSVSGQTASLRALLASDCVLRWHFALDCDIGRQGGGQGPLKERAGKGKPAREVYPTDDGNWTMVPDGMTKHQDKLGLA